MRKYTQEQLIVYMKRLARELKRSPTIKDMNRKKRYPSATTYINRFGSWNSSLTRVGLKLNVRKRYSKKELIENLQLLAKETGKIPTSTELKNKNWAASYSTYRKNFGTWKKALKSAGLTSVKITYLKEFSRKKI